MQNKFSCALVNPFLIRTVKLEQANPSTLAKVDVACCSFIAVSGNG